MAATGDDVPIIQAENLTSNVRSILYRSAPPTLANPPLFHGSGNSI
jgi:hypothetical protein